MYTIYTVKQGDTLYEIANKLGTTPNTLEKLNNINPNNILMPGTNLIVPSTNQNFMNYKVQKEDTIYDIARRYNIDPSDLLKLNGMSKEDIIYPNETIIVPNPKTNVYITKLGDTLEDLTRKLNTSIQNIINNNKILVEEDQLIITKK